MRVQRRVWACAARGLGAGRGASRSVGAAAGALLALPLRWMDSCGRSEEQRGAEAGRSEEQRGAEAGEAVTIDPAFRKLKALLGREAQSFSVFATALPPSSHPSVPSRFQIGELLRPDFSVACSCNASLHPRLARPVVLSYSVGFSVLCRAD